MRRIVRPLLLVAVVVTAVLVGGGLAGAVIPDSNGTVHGCVKSQKGALYLIDPSGGQTCGQDLPLDWNEAGATGPKGTQGLKGLPGNQGSTGSSGLEQQRDQESTDGSGDGTAEADCSSGKVAVAGGYELSSDLKPLHSGPTNGGSGWTVSVTGTANAVFAAYAICVTNGGS